MRREQEKTAGLIRDIENVLERAEAPIKCAEIFERMDCREKRTLWTVRNVLRIMPNVLVTQSNGIKMYKLRKSV